MTDEELEAIRERANDFDARRTWPGWIGDLFALIAEVDRLRTENAMLLHDLGEGSRMVHLYRMSQLEKLRNAETR